MERSVKLLEEKLEATKKALSSYEGALLQPKLTSTMKGFLSDQIVGLKELISDYTEALSLLNSETAKSDQG